MRDVSRARMIGLVLAVVFLVQSALLLGAGRLAISGHEVDVLHATEAAFRLADGQRQHIDFLTPLGVLTFWPIAVLLKAGIEISTAFLGANVLVALLLLPLVFWVSVSRFGGLTGAFFGAFVVVMITSVVFGGDQGTVSMSMYYNRWAWAAAFLILPMILLEGRGSAKVEGAVIGGLLGCLALLKMTFFVTLAPLVALAFLLRRDWVGLVAVALAGLLVAISATIIWGVDFWAAYARDLVFVSRSEVRPQPGLDFTDILAAPAFLPGSLCLLAAVVALRQSGRDNAGLLMLLATVAFVYITFQNWGNDPKFLILLGFFSLAWSPQVIGQKAFGAEARLVFLGIAVASFAIIGPTIINMGLSALRNFTADTETYVSMLDDPDHSGLMIETERSFAATAEVDIDGIGEANEPVRLGATVLPPCGLKTGYFGAVSAISDELVAAGYGGGSVAFVDVANPLPLIGGFARTAYGSPWYYGGTAEAEQAGIVVVPKCPISRVTFGAYIQALGGSDAPWDLEQDLSHSRVFTRR